MSYGAPAKRAITLFFLEETNIHEHGLTRIHLVSFGLHAFDCQGDFQWASQLKQRFRGESGHSSDAKLPLATIDILDASFEYGFEFLGNGPRLVITPLTDRIYVTATQVGNFRCHFARERNIVCRRRVPHSRLLVWNFVRCCLLFNSARRSRQPETASRW